MEVSYRTCAPCTPQRQAYDTGTYSSRLKAVSKLNPRVLEANHNNNSFPVYNSMEISVPIPHVFAELSGPIPRCRVPNFEYKVIICLWRSVKAINGCHTGRRYLLCTLKTEVLVGILQVKSFPNKLGLFSQVMFHQKTSLS